VDAARRSTTIHQGPTEQGWSDIVEKGPDARLASAVVPGFEIRLLADV
jgi:hypothetical protein